jgi:hypothetical protein
VQNVEKEIQLSAMGSLVAASLLYGQYLSCMAKISKRIFYHRLYLHHNARFDLKFIALSPILLLHVSSLGRGKKGMDWKKRLESITAPVDEELR